MHQGSALSILALGILASSVAVAQPAQEPPPPAPKPAPAAPPPAQPPPAAPEVEAGEADTEAEPAEPEPLPQPAPGPAPLAPLPTLPEPAADSEALKRQGAERPRAVPKQSETDVFAEDWWSHARPILELHGNFRLRAELFYQFSLGRVDPPGQAMWPRPADSYYQSNGPQPQGNTDALCTADEASGGSNDNPANAQACKSNTQAGANVRFRLNPELHISDNLRVISQIDLLDNLVLGSTGGGYSVGPSGTGYGVIQRNGYNSLATFDDTQTPPRSGINSLQDSISVKRAWAEYATPVGELRFGRMPHHWGLGIVNNAGDGYDHDYQTTVDRIQVVTGIKPLDLYFSGAWDFPNEGATSQTISLPNAQPYDVAQLDDVDQYVLSIARRKSPELTRLALTKGSLVVNGGVQLTYRKQLLANDFSGASGNCGSGGAALNCSPGQLKFTRRGSEQWTPDLWLQLLYKKFRFEAEAVTMQGSIESLETDSSPSTNGDEGYDINQWGFAAEIEQKLAEDKLKLGFNFGWASGDPDVDGLSPIGVQDQHGDRTIETFRFHPSYQFDLILYRNILTRVQGTYYFRPSVQYDFLRDANGQKLGGSLAAIWSRASQFIQSPGHERDLGVELNASLYFQSKDGALNDTSETMGGFFTKIEYGVLFPMAGLGYPSATAAQLKQTIGKSNAAETNTAQTVRWYLGVLF